MKRLIGISLFFIFVITGQLKTQEIAKPGDFDFYVFTLSWSPQFCATTHSQKTECQVHNGNFVVHGLWPQWNNGAWPQNCSTEAGPANPSDEADVIPDPDLVKHEWDKHGTCSALGVTGYFNMMRSVRSSIAIPDLFLNLAQAEQLSPSDIKSFFVSKNPQLTPQNIAVGCANNTLVQVQVCVAKDGKAEVACSGVKDCKAKSIKVLPVLP